MLKQLLNTGQLLDTGQLTKSAKPVVIATGSQSQRIPDSSEFRKLSSELRSLMPMRDSHGALQFRILHHGEKPLNRFARRLIAQRLATGQFK